MQTGAGHSDANGDGDNGIDAIANENHKHQVKNIKHQAVTPPSADNPFPNLCVQDVFQHSLNCIINTGIIPFNMKIHDDEMEGEAYPESEIIKVRGKDVEIDLPSKTWKPHALQWCQAYAAMVSVKT
ncbi:hypothetical protein BDQ17DRAFT_1431242 [Cyathus striatus]|nr:hypothetical protein BDQ17DRAFT_1431242 [Cyathus striatus]